MAECEQAIEATVKAKKLAFRFRGDPAVVAALLATYLPVATGLSIGLT